MKLLNWVAIVGISAIFSACDGTPQEGAYISITIPLTGDECGVDSATAVVTAPDISLLISESMNVKDFAYMTALIGDVPLGYDRLVTIEALSLEGRVVYAGSALVDVLIQDVPVALDIVLYRNFVNCPDTGVICLDPPCFGQISVQATLDNSGGPTTPAPAPKDTDNLLSTVKVWHF